MKNLQLHVFGVLLVMLVACAPQAVPAAPEVVYNGSKADIFAAVVRAISTSPGLPGSNGWIINQSDAAGGFVSANSFTSEFRYMRGMVDVQHSISVVVAPNAPTLTAVVIQFTPKAQELANRVKAALTQQFGEPITSSQN